MGVFGYALFVSIPIAALLFLAVSPVIWLLHRFQAAGPLGAVLVAAALSAVLLLPDFTGADARLGALYIFTTAAAYAGFWYRSGSSKHRSERS